MPVDSSEDQDLRVSFREFLEAEAPPAVVRGAMCQTQPFDRDLWAKVVDLGWPALPAPEAHGGLGMGVSQLTLLYSELGRSLAPIPLLPTMIVAEAIAAFGSEAQCAAHLPEIAAGRTLASLSANPGSAARLSGTGVERRIDGLAQHLLDGGLAQLLLIFATDADDVPHAILVNASAGGVVINARATVDPTRHLATATLTAVEAPDLAILARGDQAQTLMERVATHGGLAIACDAQAGAEAIFAMTLEYLKLRVQFDKPIGSFQALKHRAADHKVALEASAALLGLAIQDWAAGATGAAARASLAKSAACDLYDAVADDGLQMHGGIGLTWEHDCHLFLKRAKLDNVLFGDSRTHLDRAFAGLGASGDRKAAA